MRNFALLVLCCLSLGACSQYHDFQDKIKAHQHCAKACKTRMHFCNKFCRNDPAQCKRWADASATVHFGHYRQEKLIQGEPIGSELQGFRDPLACKKVSCDCLADFDLCIQTCQGNIHKRLQPTT